MHLVCPLKGNMRRGRREYSLFCLYIIRFLTTGARDYEILMDNGTLSEGNPQACYDIPIEDDDVLEPQEIFYVFLISLPGSTENLVTISSNISSVAIIDNDGNKLHSKQC